MPKENPDQKGFIMQFKLPADAIVTVTEASAEPIEPQILPRVNPVDVKRRYPKEASIDPDLIGDYVEKRRTLGPDHTETEAARSKLRNGIREAHQRGFDFEKVDEDFEETIYETRRNHDGRVMGSEPMSIKPIRDEFETDKLQEWYPDEPAHEEPA